MSVFTCCRHNGLLPDEPCTTPAGARADLFEERQEVAKDVQRRPSAVYL